MLLSALLVSSLPIAPEGEVYCSWNEPFLGPEVAEAWPAPALAAGITWTVWRKTVTDSIVPNYPPATCEPTAGLQSLVRAAETWEGATQAGVAVTALDLVQAEAPVACITVQSCPTGLVKNDGVNVVSLWEPASSFVPFGPTAISVSLVHLDPPTGDILGSDIAFNTTTGGQVPLYSFVEFNDAAGRWFASVADTTPNPGTWTSPSIGYVNLEGIAVHQFGHLLGLGHSLVDGRLAPTFNDFPSMAIGGHVSAPFVQTGSADTGGCSFATFTMDSATTTAGGLLGDGQETLSSDDVASIGRLYPTPDFSTQLGAISGKTLTEDTVVPEWAGPRNGFHVTAIDANNPNAVRVGVLSKGEGDYEISGLPAGSYYLYAEPVDQGDTSMFPFFQVPNYVFDSDLCSGGFCGCVPKQNPLMEFFKSEFWDPLDSDGDDSTNEVGPMVAEPVTVVAGAATTGVDFALKPGGELGGNDLIVSEATSGIVSPRGIFLSPAIGTDPTVDITIDVDPSFSGQPVTIALSPTRGALELNGERFIPGTPAAPPVLFTMTLDSQGDMTLPLVVPDSLAHWALVVQGAIVRPNLTLRMTNPATIVVLQP